jgi:hypothetical protein
MVKMAHTPEQPNFSRLATLDIAREVAHESMCSGYRNAMVDYYEKAKEGYFQHGTTAGLFSSLFGIMPSTTQPDGPSDQILYTAAGLIGVYAVTQAWGYFSANTKLKDMQKKQAMGEEKLQPWNDALEKRLGGTLQTSSEESTDTKISSPSISNYRM